MSREQKLLDRIEQLETILGADRELSNRLRGIYGLEPMHAQMLGMLYKRDFVTREGLYTVLYAGRPESEWPEEKILDVQICKLRKRLALYAEETAAPEIKIVTQWGEGWRIAQADKSRIREALKRADDADGLPVVTSPPIAPADGAAVAIDDAPSCGQENDYRRAGVVMEPA